MPDRERTIPDHTAVRVALWRALHVALDAPPHVLEDEIGLKLVAPGDGWQARPDMEPTRTRRMRASIAARARFVEDLVIDQAARGVTQYVILGAGLDTFAQRRPASAAKVRIFEVDQPDTQAWKKKRLAELGLGVPGGLTFVPVDFEAGDAWGEKLTAAGFDAKRPAIVASTGVAMYLTRETNAAKLRQIARMAPGSTLAMSFLLPIDLIEPDERRGLEAAMKGAAAAGTPFLSFFSPDDILALAREAGFKSVRHVSAADYAARYFAGRADGLAPSRGEEMLVATT